MRIAILGNESADERDAIRDHSVLLARALAAHDGVVADLHQRTASGRWIGHRSGAPRRRLDDGLGDYDWIVLQYQPFMYGRWGVAPWLVAALARLRLRRGRPRIAVMVHETFVPPESARWALMGAYQRCQLAALRMPADLISVSIGPWARQLAQWRPRRPTVHLPVGSNLPDMTGERMRERDRLGIGSEVLVLAAFGTGHPSQLTGHVAAGVNAAVGLAPRVVFLHLGDGAPPITGLDPRLEVRRPGALPAEDVARHLACADLFLAPFSDGASTRRGSLMAALQHGLPVVGTSGRSTDAVLDASTSAMRLVDVNRLGELRAAVRELSADARLRRSMGRSARELYLQTFHWPVIAERLLQELAGDHDRPRATGGEPAQTHAGRDVVR